MEGQWEPFFRQEEEKVYFKKLESVIENDRNIYNVIPSSEDTFKAFQLTSNTDIKLVIIGQDPSPSHNTATGLAFSLPRGQMVGIKDYSIQRIFDALENDDEVVFSRPNHGCLESWAKQGVLLLNAVLTHRMDKHDSNAHMDIGWDIFTKNIISFLCEKYNNLVFILWGTAARNCGGNIDRKNHLVMEGFHPSASRHENAQATVEMFISNKYFSRANKYLLQHNKTAINWQI